MNKKLSIVMCGAHPDDIELYMGGTLIKYINQGHDVKMVIATDGGKGGNNFEGLVEIRENEALAAAAVVGIEPIFLGFKDGEVIYNKETFEKVKYIIDKLKPDVIFTHDSNDYHSDHRVISRLIVDSLNFVPVFFADTFMGINFNPQFYVNIDNEYETKMKMVKLHKSQNLRVLNDMVNIQNGFRGAQCGYKKVKYAEAYKFSSKSQCLNGYKFLPEDTEDFEIFDMYNI
jgi:N-acetylglucosamine malate deacetylase 1